jgi:hypothetical protein
VKHDHNYLIPGKVQSKIVQLSYIILFVASCTLLILAGNFTYQNFHSSEDWGSAGIQNQGGRIPSCARGNSKKEKRSWRLQLECNIGEILLLKDHCF